MLSFLRILAFATILLPQTAAFVSGPLSPRSFSLSANRLKTSFSMSAYAPETVQAAWDNHLAAFGSKDVSEHNYYKDCHELKGFLHSYCGLAVLLEATQTSFHKRSITVAAKARLHGKYPLAGIAKSAMRLCST